MVMNLLREWQIRPFVHNIPFQTQKAEPESREKVNTDQPSVKGVGVKGDGAKGEGEVSSVVSS